MLRPSTLRIVLVLAALLAALICERLLVKHYRGTSGIALFDAGCSVAAAGATADCERVLASPYAYFPAKRADESPGKPHLPTALLGLVYYSFLLAWFVGIGVPTSARRSLHWIPTLVIAFGLVGSAYFLYVMATVLSEWCPWCVVTHLLNLLIAVGAVLLWRRTKLAAELPLAAPVTATGEHPVASPRMRARVALTLLAVLALIYGHVMRTNALSIGAAYATASKNLRICSMEMDVIKSDARGLVLNWQGGKKVEYTALPNDAVTPASTPGKPLELVIFSDFQCPTCRFTARYLDERVKPFFGGNLRITYKHFPICTDCNDRVSQTVHAQACVGARMAEAARTVGGNDAFWKAHDFLYAQQERLAKGVLTAAEVASELKLDVHTFKTAMESEEVTKRIASDVKLAETFNVQSTPSVYVDGRLVNTVARRQDNFWDELATVYWAMVAQQPRPESTRLANLPPATPGTPGQTTGR